MSAQSKFEQAHSKLREQEKENNDESLQTSKTRQQTVGSRRRKNLLNLKKLLNSIQNLGNEEDQIQLLTSLDSETLKDIFECVNKMINNRSPFKLKGNGTIELRKALTPYKRDIKKLISGPHLNKRQRQRFLTRRTKQVLSQGGGAVGAIFASLLPLIIQPIAELLST